MNIAGVRLKRFALLVCGGYLWMAGMTQAGVTDARIVNLSPRSFDVFLRTDPPLADLTLEVFGTPDGGVPASNVVTETQALFTGTTGGTDYERRLANRVLCAALTAQGNTVFRVSGCDAQSTYYLRVSHAGAPLWPTNATLDAVRTLPVVEWNGGARQLLVDIGRDGAGWVGLLSAPGAVSPLLAVAGDGVATNSTLFFNLTDFMDAGGTPVTLLPGDALALSVFGPPGTSGIATSLPVETPVPTTLVASADEIQKSIYRLIVSAALGLSSPAQGQYLLFDESMVTCRLEQTFLSQSNTQYVAYGWSGSGSVPVNGRATSFKFSLSSDSSLDWLWRTNFWLEVEADHGAVDLSSGWYRSGTILQADAIPDAEWAFSRWVGMAAGTDGAVSFMMTAPGTLKAEFSPLLVAGGEGMPEWWLTQAGLLGADREANADPDRDGMSNKDEWMADTSPTNTASDLRITALSQTGGFLHLTWRGGREATQVVEMLDGDLSGGGWRPVATNLPPTDTVEAAPFNWRVSRLSFSESRPDAKGDEKEKTACCLRVRDGGCLRMGGSFRPCRTGLRGSRI